jgi:hypothetical protein
MQLSLPSLPPFSLSPIKHRPNRSRRPGAGRPRAKHHPPVLGVCLSLHWMQPSLLLSVSFLSACGYALKLRSEWHLVRGGSAFASCCVRLLDPRNAFDCAPSLCNGGEGDSQQITANPRCLSLALSSPSSCISIPLPSRRCRPILYPRLTGCSLSCTACSASHAAQLPRA